MATASLVLNGWRVTLALGFVLPGDDTVRGLDTRLQRVKGQGLRLRCLLLDKGFDGIAELEYLTPQGQPARRACTIRGTTGGTRALCQGRKSYGTTPPCKGAPGTEVTAALLVCRVFTTARRTGRLRRRGEWWLFSHLHLALSPRYARQLSRSRFGLDTSYRGEGQVRGWTTAKNPAYRFVLIALAFGLLNGWIPLRWLFTQVAQRGGRWLDTPRFQLTRFAKFLQRALEAWYGGVRAITAPALPRG